MRILKVTQVYWPYVEKGGPVVKVKALAEHLASRGHRVTVVTVHHRSRTGAGVSDGGERTNPGPYSGNSAVQTLYLRTVARYRTLTVNPGIMAFCWRHLRDFDVVHIYGLYDLLGPVVAAFCRRWGVPYVLEPLGMTRPIVRSVRKKRLWLRWLGRSLFRGAATIIATSSREREELIEAGFPSTQIVIRRNGIDLSDYALLPPRGGFRREVGIPDGEPVVLYFGRLSHKKGLDLLLRAFAGLQIPAWLVIVGPDDRDGCVKHLEHLRRQLGLEQRVVLRAEPRYGLRKLELFADADVFVLPSRSENFGNTAAEAIACGLPVVVTDRCGIAPLVEGRVGLVVPYAEEAIREALGRLLGNPGLRETLRRGTVFVRRELSWEEPTEEMERLYQRLVQRPPNG